VAYVDSKYLVRPNYLHQSIKGDQQFVTPQLTLPDYDHDHDCSLINPISITVWIKLSTKTRTLATRKYLIH
jgi:hypothetical protein